MTAPPSRRRQLVDATRQLALRKGLPAATVDEICAEAGVTKGSFYHHFNSKEALGLAAIQSYFDDISEALAGDWADESDARQRLLAFIDHCAGVFGGPLLVHGCLLGTISLDLAEVSPVFQAEVATKFDELHAAILPNFDDVAARLPDHVTAAELADQLLALIEGSIVLAKAHRTPTSPTTQLHTFRHLIEMLTK